MVGGRQAGTCTLPCDTGHGRASGSECRIPRLPLRCGDTGLPSGRRTRLTGRPLSPGLAGAWRSGRAGKRRRGRAWAAEGLPGRPRPRGLRATSCPSGPLPAGPAARPSDHERLWASQRKGPPSMTLRVPATAGGQGAALHLSGQLGGDLPDGPLRTGSGPPGQALSSHWPGRGRWPPHRRKLTPQREALPTASRAACRGRPGLNPSAPDLPP